MHEVRTVAFDEHLTEYSTLETLLNDLENRNDPMIDLPASMRQYLERKARARGVPLHGTFELTPRCNLDCKMCYVHLSGQQMAGKQLLSADAWKSLMAQAIGMGMLDATFTGGECLTYPGFDELYLYLWDRGVRTSILTNGVLLTEERIRFFRQHPPKGIQITLYGSSEDEYEAVTGHRCFETVIAHIRKAAQTKIPLSIAITPNRFLPDGGEKLVHLANGLGIWYSINTNLFRPRAETGRQNEAIDLTDEEYIRLHLLRRRLKGIPIEANPCELPPPAQSGKRQKGLLCSAGNSAFHIRWDGRMQPCGSFEGVEAEPLREGFQSAWEKIHAACTQYPLPEECAECPYRVLCPACVMAHRQGAAPGHASPVLCQRARKLVQSGLAALNEE